MKNKKIGVIDVFAGPGGLSEGFANFLGEDGEHPFEIAVSAEKEVSAHSTLTLRAFSRLLRSTGPDLLQKYNNVIRRPDLRDHLEQIFSEEPFDQFWHRAQRESLNLTLGEEEHDRELYGRISAVQRNFDELVLIGGPPCQAYSLVGRARNANVPGFKERGDHRHFLYRKYLDILAAFSPAVFVMENVKGMLSSTVGGKVIFDTIVSDLARPGRALGIKSKESLRYRILPVMGSDLSTLTNGDVDPREFIVRSENYGIPQTRHRVILLGVREDFLPIKNISEVELSSARVSSGTALSTLPRLRSGISRRPDSVDEWLRSVERERKTIVSRTKRTHPELANYLANINFDDHLPRTASSYHGRKNRYVSEMRKTSLDVVANHESRGNMSSDLGRYLFASAWMGVYDYSPKSAEFPGFLAPEHANWKTGKFADRFRVLSKHRPSPTVTSHLSKDGHAFIHWDVSQCRSITVREAARLQSFPDDYIFLGNRTQQFVQVGNAVPPILAEKIARIVHSVVAS